MNTQITLENFKQMTDEQKQSLPGRVYKRLTAELEQEEKNKLAEEARAKNKEIALSVIARYNAKHPTATIREVFMVKVEDAVAWVRKPTREIIKMITATAATDVLGAAELLLENCWVEGDDRIKDEDDYFFSASAQLKDIMEMKTAEIVKF